MANHHSSRAIIVLESPWGLDESDANRSSVLPFVEGIAKLVGDMEVLHANFYDESSFEKALACLCKTDYSNIIVYVAAHGDSGATGDVDHYSMFYEIDQWARKFNITGVMLGSCYAGKDSEKIEACIEASPIRWCVGYASSVAWLTGTLLDCSMLAYISRFDPEELDRNSMIFAFSQALVPFSTNAVIGKDEETKLPVMLEDSLQFIVQPAGRGFRVKNVSQEIFEKASESRNQAKR